MKFCPRRGAQSLVERGKRRRAGWEMKNFNQGLKEPSAEGCWPPRLAWSNNGCECPAFQISLTSCPKKNTSRALEFKEHRPKGTLNQRCARQTMMSTHTKPCQKSQPGFLEKNLLITKHTSTFCTKSSPVS